jgi:hypothetical protein
MHDLQQRKRPPLLAKPAAFRVSVHGAAMAATPSASARKSSSIFGKHDA